VGPITAFWWRSGRGEVQRFSSIKKAVATAGCAAPRRVRRNTVQRTPLSKQTEQHKKTLQTTLIEAAKDAPRLVRSWQALDTEKQKGNANRATLRRSSAAKLVARLWRSTRQRDFQVVAKKSTACA